LDQKSRRTTYNFHFFKIKSRWRRTIKSLVYSSQHI